jgi:hypothetical protein
MFPDGSNFIVLYISTESVEKIPDLTTVHEIIRIKKDEFFKGDNFFGRS